MNDEYVSSFRGIKACIGDPRSDLYPVPLTLTLQVGLGGIARTIEELEVIN
jgi:hypothetical protein